VSFRLRARCQSWPVHPASQVELVGSAVLRLVAHREDYFMRLPDLLLEGPLSPSACRPGLTGPLRSTHIYGTYPEALNASRTHPLAARGC